MCKHKGAGTGRVQDTGQGEEEVTRASGVHNYADTPRSFGQDALRELGATIWSSGDLHGYWNAEEDMELVGF